MTAGAARRGWVGATRDRVRQPSDLLDEVTAGSVELALTWTMRLGWTLFDRARHGEHPLPLPDPEIVGPGVVRLPLRIGDEPGTAIRLSLPAYEGERFVGFGERCHALDQRGYVVEAWAEGGAVGFGETLSPWLARLGVAWNPFPKGPATSTKPLPWFLSSRGYGLLLSTAAPILFDVARTDPRQVICEVADRAVDVLLFFGDTPAAILELLTARVGRPRPLPDWAFAPWNDAGGGQEEVLRIARLLRHEEIPSSVLSYEDWQGGQWRASWLLGDELTAWLPAGLVRRLRDWGHYSLFPVRRRAAQDLYPDVVALNRRLHEHGFKAHGYCVPYVATDDPDYEMAASAGYFLTTGTGAPCTFPLQHDLVAQVDLTNPAARTWYRGFLDEAVGLGFDGWVHDLGYDTPVEAGTSMGESGLAHHNRYPVLWAELARDVLEAARPGGDFVFVSRASGLGQAAATPVFCGADATTDFERWSGLPSHPRGLLSAGLSGLPIWASDIGGSVCYLSQGRDVETLMRWTEFAALLPIMRTQRGSHPGWNAQFDRDAAVLAHYRTYARLHTALFPHFRLLVDEAARRGLPVCRALLLENPHDPVAWTIDDEFLLGSDLLVAPVLERGAESRRVHLPRPGTWIDLWRGTRHAGGSRFEVAASVGVIPLFLRVSGLLTTLDTPVDTLVRRAGGVTEPLRTLDDAERSLALTIGPDFVGPAVLYDGTRVWWANERHGPVLEPPPTEHSHALLPERMTTAWRRIGSGVGRAGAIACGKRWLGIESPIERRFTIWTPGR